MKNISSIRGKIRVRVKSARVEYYRYADSADEAIQIRDELRAAHPSQRGRCRVKPLPRPKPAPKPIGRPKVAQEPIQAPCGLIVPAKVGVRCKPHETCPHYYPTCIDLTSEADFSGWEIKEN